MNEKPVSGLLSFCFCNIKYKVTLKYLTNSPPIKLMQKTILITDDSAMIRRIVGQLLQGFGYKILLADNGEEGYIQTKSEKPDLVIMDVEMPVMTGIEATKRIKNDPDTSSIPVLIFTSLSREEDIQQAKNAGCIGFLNKPICEDELREAVNKILAQE
jgi:CheY-like chemotaxis protein